MAFVNQPSLNRVGHTIVKLTDKQFSNYSSLWRARKLGELSKTAQLLKAISDNPLSQTNALRHIVDCSNVPDLVGAINKKLMNKGYMVIRLDPIGVAPNEDFHYWCLVEAPIVKIPVQMSSNDPLLN
ncbi:MULTISPECIES: hypothetical protein [unclassified Vibrio]|uniref:hypothetical protein n=1 Tax=unclassified Vibrio TaxID=2614977 RepID=UPI000C848478|nr:MULTISPECIES: hypothetical protein [unclassified Vibrio]PMI92511.1 hypothetical protein BCU34_20970 [Vibrio sp. 10N.286.45.E10]PTO94852.1 hypothetical protein CWO17_23905 [Vibrio sp. 10N.286.45.A3]PTQ19198.1 hypothetical protein CWO24_23280 [Vibrio sp. 10N.286.46.E10]TKE76192.1 hypothetical protein FCV56_20665 [Vibrio sp. F12]TKE90451.1 hypothetical protein FCV61_23365 [Vibrio sp. F12]